MFREMFGKTLGEGKAICTGFKQPLKRGLLHHTQISIKAKGKVWSAVSCPWSVVRCFAADT
jgi:hypothetical protein